MRMWMIPPQWMCIRHLLGEHGEIHKNRHNFEKQHSITGRVKPEVQIEPMAMQSRHDQLEGEIRRRNPSSTCNSPYTMPDLSYLPDHERNAQVDTSHSLCTLMNRCEDCNATYMEAIR